MEFILADEKGIEIGPLRERDYIDIDCGNDNTFEIQVTNDYYKKLGISDGWRLGVQGKEYGGVIRKIITNTETNLVSLIGPTWRGMLEKKIIEPPAGEDYRIVSGDANTIINEVSCVEFDGIFICAGASGIILNNFQFDRYVTHLAGLEKMLLSKNARLDIAYDSGEPNEASFVRLAAVPIKDYSDEIEYSQDGTLSFLSFTFESDSGGINHLICLGKGKLKERLVLHLYADADGNISDKQSFFGKDERVTVYNYSNASSEDELREKGTERLKELLSYKSMDMDLFNESLAGLRGVNDDISIGDIVGGRDFDTGIYLSKQITKKIVQVKNGKESIEYSVGKRVLNRSTANSPVEQSDPLDKLIKITTDETGLSIGKDAELNKTFDIGLQTYLREKLLIEFNKFIFMKTSDGTELGVMGITNENELIINWDGYDAKRGSTSVYGNNVNIIGNNIALGGTVTVNGTNLDLDSRSKAGTMYASTLADFVTKVYQATSPYAMAYSGRVKDESGWGPNGYACWYQFYAIMQNAPGGNYSVDVFTILQYGNDTYIGCINGTSSFAVTWKKLAKVVSNSVWDNPSSQKLYIASGNENDYRLFLGVADSNWVLCPSVDGYLRCGTASFRWGQVYAKSSAISTSDRNVKKDIKPLNDRYIKFFTMLKPLSYKFVDGTSGRTHIGFISQDVEEAMTACGLSDLDFAGFCKDQKYESITLEDGTVEQKIVEGEYIYSLRYEEFIALNTCVIQKQQSEIEMLKDEIAKIKSAIGL